VVISGGEKDGQFSSDGGIFCGREKFQYFVVGGKKFPSKMYIISCEGMRYKLDDNHAKFFGLDEVDEIYLESTKMEILILLMSFLSSKYFSSSREVEAELSLNELLEMEIAVRELGMREIFLHAVRSKLDLRRPLRNPLIRGNRSKFLFDLNHERRLSNILEREEAIEILNDEGYTFNEEVFTPRRSSKLSHPPALEKKKSLIRTR
jgi:hypothetical protein